MKTSTANLISVLLHKAQGLILDMPNDAGPVLAEMQTLLTRAIAEETACAEGLDVNASEIELMRQGQVIWAIKEVRQRTGLGLREAKDLVEAAGIKLGFRVPDPTGWGGYRWKKFGT